RVTHGFKPAFGQRGLTGRLRSRSKARAKPEQKQSQSKSKARAKAKPEQKQSKGKERKGRARVTATIRSAVEPHAQVTACGVMPRVNVDRGQGINAR
ncbi:hypothetical protein ACNPP5_31245, partial [Pseudomonas sp. AGC67]